VGVQLGQEVVHIGPLGGVRNRWGMVQIS
jgi:hypothetical protein